MFSEPSGHGHAQLSITEETLGWLGRWRLIEMGLRHVYIPAFSSEKYTVFLNGNQWDREGGGFHIKCSNMFVRYKKIINYDHIFNLL